MKTDVNFLRRPSRRDLVLSFRQLLVVIIVLLVLMVVHYQFQLATLPEFDVRTENVDQNQTSSAESSLQAPQWLSDLSASQNQMAPSLIEILEQIKQAESASFRVIGIDMDAGRKSVRLTLEADTQAALMQHLERYARSVGSTEVKVQGFSVLERANAWQGRIELRFVPRRLQGQGEG